MSDLGDLRSPYNEKTHTFLENNIEPKDPFDLFHKWFLEAKNSPTIVEPNAMCLATATKDGKPSARFVLCKGYGQEGFKFFTHYTSRKGQEMEENPYVALTFYWDCLSRSVRIEGKVEKLPFSEADKYFHSRPQKSQIGALCSDQSKPISGRNILEQNAIALREKYKEGQVPRPEFWGGYLVVPSAIEFWQGQTDRIHDRIRFRYAKDEKLSDLLHKGEGNWVYERLQP